MECEAAYCDISRRVAQLDILKLVSLALLQFIDAFVQLIKSKIMNQRCNVQFSLGMRRILKRDFAIPTVGLWQRRKHAPSSWVANFCIVCISKNPQLAQGKSSSCVLKSNDPHPPSSVRHECRLAVQHRTPEDFGTERPINSWPPSMFDSGHLIQRVETSDHQPGDLNVLG